MFYHFQSYVQHHKCLAVIPIITSHPFMRQHVFRPTFKCSHLEPLQTPVPFEVVAWHFILPHRSSLHMCLISVKLRVCGMRWNKQMIKIMFSGRINAQVWHPFRKPQCFLGEKRQGAGCKKSRIQNNSFLFSFYCLSIFSPVIPWIETLNRHLPPWRM